MKDKYHCLITENYNEDKSDLIECCMPYKNISRGIILYCSVYYTLGLNMILQKYIDMFHGLVTQKLNKVLHGRSEETHNRSHASDLMT